MATKKKTTKEAKVQDAQKKKAIQQTVINRELKYLYPDDCTDTLSRKAFRQKIRNEIRRLERSIRKLETKGEEKKVKTLYRKVKSLREKTLADPQMEV